MLFWLQVGEAVQWGEETLGGELLVDEFSAFLLITQQPKEPLENRGYGFIQRIYKVRKYPSTELLW